MQQSDDPAGTDGDIAGDIEADVDLFARLLDATVVELRWPGRSQGGQKRSAASRNSDRDLDDEPEGAGE